MTGPVRVGRRQAFTLVELLVVVSIIALLISILLPSLKKAREQAKSVVCLANLKSLSTGVLTYTNDYNGTLPGPLHPALYRHQTKETWGTGATAEYIMGRQLAYVLRGVMGQRSDGGKANTADKVGTCPTLTGIVPDSVFETYINNAFPTHYAINNWGANSPEPVMVGAPRGTIPEYYFGESPPPVPSATALAAAMRNHPPRPLNMIRRSSDEWMLADAWYRRVGTTQAYNTVTQEGTFHSSWTGNVLPPFAPHFKEGAKSFPNNPDTVRYDFANKAFSVTGKGDGRTNATYFDGHAASVNSKKAFYVAPTGQRLPKHVAYGFPGTVNGKLPTLGGYYVWE